MACHLFGTKSLSAPMLAYCQLYPKEHIDGLVQDCSNSIANALELPLSYTKPSIFQLNFF